MCTALKFNEITLFLIVGFPEETDDDINKLIEFIKKALLITKSGRSKLCISINPFFSKPGTPFQWAGIESFEKTCSKFNKIKKEFENEVSMRIVTLIGSCEHMRQNILSRGDRRINSVLIDVQQQVKLGTEETKELWKAALIQNDISLDDLFSEKTEDYCFSWNTYNPQTTELYNKWSEMKLQLIGSELNDTCK